MATKRADSVELDEIVIIDGVRQKIDYIKRPLYPDACGCCWTVDYERVKFETTVMADGASDYHVFDKYDQIEVEGLTSDS